MTLAELGMPSLRSLLPIPRVHQALDEDGNPTDERGVHGLARFLDEFIWYAEALAAQRSGGVPY